MISRPDLQPSSSNLHEAGALIGPRLEEKSGSSYRRPQRRSSIPLVPIYVSLLPLFLLMGFLLGAAITYKFVLIFAVTVVVFAVVALLSVLILLFLLL